MTDLKLENTLYDKVKHKAQIIDLGGIFKGVDRQSLENVRISKVKSEYTYISPEINEYKN